MTLGQLLDWLEQMICGPMPKDVRQLMIMRMQDVKHTFSSSLSMCS